MSRRRSYNGQLRCEARIGGWCSPSDWWQDAVWGSASQGLRCSFLAKYIVVFGLSGWGSDMVVLMLCGSHLRRAQEGYYLEGVMCYRAILPNVDGFAHMITVTELVGK